MKHANKASYSIGFLCLLLCSFISSSKPTRPLKSIFFDRNGSYYLVFEDWNNNTIELIDNPYIIEEYKEQLEIQKEKSRNTTPAYHFDIVRDNVVIKRIHFFNSKNLKIGKDLKMAFKTVNKNNVRNMNRAEFINKIKELDEKGVLWYGPRKFDFEGSFIYSLRMKESIVGQISESLITSKIYQNILEKYPMFVNRFEEFSIQPTENGIIKWEVCFNGNKNENKLLENIKLEGLDFIVSFEYKSFFEKKYNLVYFEALSN